MQQGMGVGATGGGHQPRLQPITVENIVATDVVTAQRDTPIATVVAEMAEKEVGSVVVVEDDEPVGILTDRKIALALESTPDVSERTAGDLTGGDLVTGSTDMNVFEAIDLLSDHEIRRLPVVDDDGSLAGILTLDDIVVLQGSELNKATQIIKAQSPRL
jgi:CBS domain-containing protein